MTTVTIWGEATREVLREDLAGSLVVLPIGATEQHGPHLPTGTDILIASRAAADAAALAVGRGSIPIVLAPPLPFGISDHHRAFGGTLSLSTTTMLALLTDLVDSIAMQGGRRLLIVNGHGGNRGIARAVASAADAHATMTIAAVDYWDCAPGRSVGHAGATETSLVLALAAEQVAPRSTRAAPAPPLPSIGAATYHGAWLWRDMDGYTDDPAEGSAEDGRAFFAEVVDGLADLMVGFGGLPA